MNWATSCKLSAGHFPLLTALIYIVKWALGAAGLSPFLESVRLNKRGQTALPFACGRCMLWDIMVVDAFCGSNANLAEAAKYASLIVAYDFQLLGFETSRVVNPNP